jgi:hypothetical protein
MCICIPHNILKIIDSLTKEKKFIHPIIRIPTEDKFVDEPCIFPDVHISEISEFEPIEILVRRFSEAGIPLLINDIVMSCSCSSELTLTLAIISYIEYTL